MFNKEYIAWYRETRCEHFDSGKQCQQEKEIMVKTLSPTLRSKYCYYHNKKMEGRFNTTPEICKKQGGQS